MIQTLHSHPRRAAMDDDDLFLRVLGRGKLAFTVEGKTFLHVFRPRARGPTLQLKLPTEAPDHHLRVFVDGGELVFLVSAEKEEVKGAARHVGAVRIPSCPETGPGMNRRAFAMAAPSGAGAAGDYRARP